MPAALIGVLGMSAVGGCGTGSPGEAGAEAGPLPIPPASGPGPASTSTTSAPLPSVAGDAATSRPATDQGEQPTGSVERDQVAAALERYDRALTALSAAPEAVDDPADALLGEWHAITLEGTDLDRDVLARIRGRRDEGIAVTPPADAAPSYVHHVRAAVRVTPPPGLADPPEEISFTWCAWSPGIGRRIGNAAVVDDVVGSAAGTGTIRRDAGDRSWRLTSLFETSFEALAPGSGDPCV